MSIARRYAALLFAVACFLFLASPGHPAGLTDGLPLRPWAIIVALLLPPLFYALGRWIPGQAALLGAGALLAFSIVKIALSQASPEYGLTGSYYDNSRFNGRPERSSEFRLADATRRDRELDFGGDEFPVYFFNDSERFNFYGSGQPQRRQLPFSTRWTGFFLAPADGAYTFRLTASGQAMLDIDGVERLSVDAEGRASQERTVNLRAGAAPIRAEYARRPQRSPDFRVDWVQDGRPRPLAAPYLRPSADGPSLEVDALLRTLALGLDTAGFLTMAAVFGAGAVSAGRRQFGRNEAVDSSLGWERALIGLVPFGFAVYGALPRLDRVGKMVYLGGGQDWLLHETLARDILINGPLMTLGKDLGEGRAFYAQPLYPYALALLHGIFGEDQFGPVAAQVAMLGFVCVTMWELSRRLFGRAVAWTTLALITPFALHQLDWVSRRLISESLYFLLLPLTLLACVVAHRRGALHLAAVAGALMGLAVLTRGTTLLLLPIAAALLWRARGLRLAGVLVVMAILIISLAPIRNVIVSGRPVLLATSGGVNMEKFHRPTDMVRLAGVDQNPVYNRLGLDKPTREVLEFIRQDPAGYIQACLVLAAYTVGFGFALDEAQVPLYPDLIALSAIYVLTLMLVSRARVPEAHYIHAFVGIHFFSMVIFTPYDYENRLVLPMFIPMLGIAALGLVSATLSLHRLSRGGAALEPSPLGMPAKAPDGR